MDEYNVLVGLDVHARSAVAQLLVKETGETATKRFGQGYTAADVAQLLAKYPGSAYVAYESGCTGVGLCRDLREMDIDCDVIAVSTLPRSSKDRQQKCDRLDARAILREISNPMSNYSTVWIPTAEQEAARDLCRLLDQMRCALKRSRQELTSFLLRNGYVFCQKTKTGRAKKPKGRAYESWLDTIAFQSVAAQIAFSELRRAKDDAEQAYARVRAQVESLSKTPEYAPYVDALRCLKGIERTTAMAIVAEFGDFTRFKSGRKVPCWLGVVPRNDSSGESERHGCITKAGNKYLRRLLVEALCAISTWSGPSKTPPKDAVVSASIAAACRRANRRIFERYHHLTRDLGKQTNKAKIACVSELARWCWAIGLSVQKEQAMAA